MAYCTQADVYAYGLPPGSLANPGRLLSGVSVESNLLRLGGHGFSLDDQVTFRAEGCASLPDPLNADSVYWVVPHGEHAFGVKDSPTATAEIQLLTEGEDTLVIAAVPWDKSLDWGAAIVDSYLPAHVVPLSPPYPPRVVHWNAVLAAQKLIAWSGSTSVDLNSVIEQARRDLEAFAKGAPLRGANSPERTNIAASASAVARDRHGWRRGGLC